ncbi:ARH37 factor, partial [Amia calva]|nr:ARH37 factor [Amia calva]
MEMVYREYCANYNNIAAMENRCKQNEAVWEKMLLIIKSSAPDINATSLTFFLVMPIQRIARYPLHLQTILKHTDPQHPAYSALEETAQATVEINCRINEYKRFREVADKYRKTESLTMKDRMSRLNGHSIAKKTLRLQQLLKHETGIKVKVKDEEFDALEEHFNLMEKGIVDLHDNMKTYIIHLQDYLMSRPDESDLDLDSEQSAHCYKEIRGLLHQMIYPTFEYRLQSLVFKPLCSLRELLDGPRNLIRKHLDKLLDFELLEEKQSLTYEEEEVVNTYKTINSLLVAELPQFNGTALQLLRNIQRAYIRVHKDLAAEIKQLVGGYVQKQPHSHLDPSAFWQWAGDAVQEEAKKLKSLCQNVEKQLNDPIVQPLNPSLQKRLEFLSKRHAIDRIYQLTGNVGGSRDLDLTLQRGELVGVLQEMDTSGDRRRWLVDAGGPRGYVPSAKLKPYHQVTQAPPSFPRLLSHKVGGADTRRHSYSVLAPPLTLSSTPCFQVFAAYDFSARGHHEVTLRAGEPVNVLEPCDKQGNPEWSLVKVRGQQGYVPSNYLTMLPTPVARSNTPAT